MELDNIRLKVLKYWGLYAMLQMKLVCFECCPITSDCWMNCFLRWKSCAMETDSVNTLRCTWGFTKRSVWSGDRKLPQIDTYCILSFDVWLELCYLCHLIRPLSSTMVKFYFYCINLIAAGELVSPAVYLDKPASKIHITADGNAY